MNEGQKLDQALSRYGETIDNERLNSLIHPGTLLWGMWDAHSDYIKNILERGILPPRIHRKSHYKSDFNPNCVCLSLTGKYYDPLWPSSAWSHFSDNGPVIILKLEEVIKRYQGKITAVGEFFYDQENNDQYYDFSKNNSLVYDIPIANPIGNIEPYPDEVNIELDENCQGITYDVW